MAGEETLSAVAFMQHKVLHTLQHRLQGNALVTGCLYGVVVDRSFYICGCCSVDPNRIEEDAKIVSNYLPAGLVVFGIFLTTSQTDADSEVLDRCSSSSTVSVLDGLDGPNLFVLALGQTSSCETRAFWYNAETQKLVRTDFSIVNDSEPFPPADSLLTFHVQASFPLNFQHLLDQEARHCDILSSADKLKDITVSGAAAYLIADSDLVLYNRDLCDWPGQTSWISEATVLELYDRIKGSDSSVGKGKRKADVFSSSAATINVRLLIESTGPSTVQNSLSCIPIIHYTHEACKFVETRIDVDVIAVTAPSTPIYRLPSLFSDGICRQLSSIADCLVKFGSSDSYYMPRPFHFKPDELGHIVTLILPEGVPDTQLEPVRREIHSRFLLGLTRPLFRRLNSIRYGSSKISSNPYLQDVHIGIKTSAVVGGRQFLVRGHYEYRHYMQDRIDDNGWGCAYRSLQTLVSWFRLQGYTEKPVPSHSDIQRTLVEIGDKEATFIDSRKWIGSTEVNYVLDHSYGISCKIIHVSSGAEMSTRARELAQHFETHSSPIMIGGGVLAHTILGVDWNEDSGQVMFLILDPHYTGSEDLKVIQDKGWCGWKGVDFWDQHVYYNMCLPLRPAGY